MYHDYHYPDRQIHFTTLLRAEGNFVQSLFKTWRQIPIALTEHAKLTSGILQKKAVGVHCGMHAAVLMPKYIKQKCNHVYANR